MRIVDISLSFPEMVAAMAVAGILGHGTFNLVFALALAGWMRYARLVRGITVLSLNLLGDGLRDMWE